MSTNFNKFECNLFVIEFSVPNDPYFPEKDYICVSSVDNENAMNSLINHFITHNQAIYNINTMVIMPKKTYDTVFQPLITSVADFNKKLDGMTEWNASDDLQWIKYLGNHRYELYQIVLDDEDTARVFHDDVDVSDFISSSIQKDEDFENGISAIRMYGYGEDVPDDGTYTFREQLSLILSEIRDIYGDNYEKIIAEMLFETYFCNSCECAYKHVTDAVDYVMEKIND